MAFVWRNKGQKTFMMRYRKHGRWITESSGTKVKREARKIAHAKETDAERGVPVGPGVGKLTLADGVALILADYQVNDRDTARSVEYRYRLHLEPFFGGTTKLVEIDDADAYAIHRQREGAKNGTINREVDLLRRAFRLAVAKKKLAFAPTFPRLREKNVRAGFFEREQFEAVRAHLPELYRGIVTVAYITGWRMDSEILPLEWRHVDLEAWELRLDPYMAKNDDPRVFPMTDALRSVFLAQRAIADALKQQGILETRVFVRLVATERGGAAAASPKVPKPITRFVRTWKAACRAAGCPGRIPHDFRRTAVRNLTRLGVNERVAMQMVGMKTRSIFDRYRIVAESDLRDARQKLQGHGV